MKVIVADDSMMTRNIVIKFLKPLGCSTIQAANGEEVIKILGSEDPLPDLILLDWNMPVLDGYQALQIIGKDERYKGIPVIMLTSESDNINKTKALYAGAKAYVTKPFTEEDLIQTINETLEK